MMTGLSFFHLLNHEINPFGCGTGTVTYDENIIACNDHITALNGNILIISKNIKRCIC